jgi:hypothetical protein
MASRKARRAIDLTSTLSAGGLGLGLMRSGGLAEAGEEEGLVDPTVEDRDAQLDALHDYVSTLEA